MIERAAADLHATSHLDDGVRRVELAVGLLVGFLNTLDALDDVKRRNEAISIEAVSPTRPSTT